MLVSQDLHCEVEYVKSVRILLDVNLVIALCKVSVKESKTFTVGKVPRVNQLQLFAFLRIVHFE